MTQVSGPTAVYPLAPLPASALAGVRTRRTIAILLDLLLISLLSIAPFFLLAVLGLGVSPVAFLFTLFASFWLAIFILPAFFAVIAFFYNGITISGWRRATPGMKAMDLEMRRVDGAPVPFLYAAFHAVLFYLSWMVAPILLISLVTPDKRCLHDMLAGVIVLRRA